MHVLAALFVALLSGRSLAEQVSFPLVIDYPILEAALTRQLSAEPDGTAVLWGARGGCRSLTVRELHFGRASEGERVRLTASGAARVGFGFLGFCIAPVSWKGHLETLATPRIGADWQLGFRDVDARVYDTEWRRTAVASRLWSVVKGRVEEELTGFTFDLGPPLDEAKALIRASVERSRATAVLQALDTLRPLAVEVGEEGLTVRAALDVPSVPPTAPAPEPGLAPIELQRWQSAVENWDGFLVFVIKDIAALDADERIREQLVDLLIDSRHELLGVLATEPSVGVDPVRRLFLDTWERLRRIVREAAAQGALRDRALRYLSFLAAGDALAALDAAGPALGIEISADGLRRLARVLEPDFVGDPVGYSDAPDAVLRELFRLHDPEPGPAPAEPPLPPDAWWWPGPRAARASAPPADELAALARRLDRWVPAPDELETYRDAVGRLLTIVSERTAAINRVDDRFATVYRHLVATTAWQESCWRQFVQRDGKVTYLLSKSGDIGIMQVNRRVWRGLFDMTKLEWDITYNAGAGAEILAQLLRRYGAREAGSRPENAARAAYSAYNGGPDAYRRYRLQKAPRRLRAIDRAFWEKYQAVASGAALDFVLCVERWESPVRARLSTEPVASTPKCCMSSRSSPATATMSARHASIASRPRASLVKSPLEKPASMAS